MIPEAAASVAYKSLGQSRGRAGSERLEQLTEEETTHCSTYGWWLNMVLIVLKFVVFD